MVNGNCSNQGIKARCIKLDMNSQMQTKKTQESIESDNLQLPTQTEEMKIFDIKMIQAFGVLLLNSNGKPREDMCGKYGNE